MHLGKRKYSEVLSLPNELIELIISYLDYKKALDVSKLLRDDGLVRHYTEMYDKALNTVNLIYFPGEFIAFLDPEGTLKFRDFRTPYFMSTVPIQTYIEKHNVKLMGCKWHNWGLWYVTNDNFLYVIETGEDNILQEPRKILIYEREFDDQKITSILIERSQQEYVTIWGYKKDNFTYKPPRYFETFIQEMNYTPRIINWMPFGDRPVYMDTDGYLYYYNSNNYYKLPIDSLLTTYLNLEESMRKLDIFEIECLQRGIVKEMQPG